MSETGAGMLGAAFAADFWAGDMSQVGLTYQRRRVTAFGDAMQSQRIGARLMTRPRRDVRIAVTGGMWSPGFGKLGGIQPEATVRLRKTPFTHAGMVDISSGPCSSQHVVDGGGRADRGPAQHSRT